MLQYYHNLNLNGGCNNIYSAWEKLYSFQILSSDNTKYCYNPSRIAMNGQTSYVTS